MRTSFVTGLLCLALAACGYGDEGYNNATAYNEEGTYTDNYTTEGNYSEDANYSAESTNYGVTNDSAGNTSGTTNAADTVTNNGY